MMLSLAVVATFAEIYSSSKFSISNVDGAEGHDLQVHHSPVHASLSKIELPSILFFLGILISGGGIGILRNAIPLAGNLE